MNAHKRVRGLGQRAIDETAELLAAAASPMRLKLLLLLEGGEATVGDLAQRLKLSHAVVSQHLNKLRLMRLVVRRMEGRSAYYRLASSDILSLLDWVHSRQYAKAGFQDGAAI